MFDPASRLEEVEVCFSFFLTPATNVRDQTDSLRSELANIMLNGYEIGIIIENLVFSDSSFSGLNCRKLLLSLLRQKVDCLNGASG